MRGSPQTNNASKDENKTEQCDPNRDKTIHCQRKRRKKHPASNVAAESAPHPGHAAKACDNNTQTIPNNMVLWQRWATCRWGWRPCQQRCSPGSCHSIFFRPTPSWLPPGRSTCFIVCCKLGLID